MAYLHRITHDNPNISEKVNFFADYFVYAASHIGCSEYIPLENPLSLIEKIIFQLEYNSDNSKQYIDEYLKDPLFINKEFLKEFNNYDVIESLINEYQNLESKKQKKWLPDNNQNFISQLKIFHKALKESMITKSFKAIISFLKCSHKLKKHIKDLKFFTRILVTEFYFTGRTRDELKDIFERIITREVRMFPFPEGIKSANKKKEFIEQRTFDQQFEGIINLLNRNRYENIFYFGIKGILIEDDFKFRYNHVTFLSSNHPDLEKARTVTKDEPFTKDFFLGEPFLVAKVKVGFHSIELGKQEAVKLINEEIKFLQIITKTYIALDVFNYIITNNNRHFGGTWNSTSKKSIPSESTLSKLKDNPFVFLAKYKNDCVDSILKHEHIYIKALNSGLPSDYWHYLEILIPKNEDGGKRAKDVISHALLLNEKSTYKKKLKHYIITCISPFDVSASELGISKEKQTMYFQKRKFSLRMIKNEIKNNFINDVISAWYREKDLVSLQSYYYSILTETYSVRNSYIHSGKINEKSALKIHHTLPYLIMRFRWILFDQVKKNKHTNFEELINAILTDGKLILERKIKPKRA